MPKTLLAIQQIDYLVQWYHLKEGENETTEVSGFTQCPAANQLWS